MTRAEKIKLLRDLRTAPKSQALIIFKARQASDNWGIAAKFANDLFLDYFLRTNCDPLADMDIFHRLYSEVSDCKDEGEVKRKMICFHNENKDLMQTKLLYYKSPACSIKFHGPDRHQNIKGTF